MYISRRSFAQSIDYCKSPDEDAGSTNKMTCPPIAARYQAAELLSVAAVQLMGCNHVVTEDSKILGSSPADLHRTAVLHIGDDASAVDVHPLGKQHFDLSRRTN